MNLSMNLSQNSAYTGEILTVSVLNQTVRDLLETGFSNIWVEGELSTLTRPSSGHLYFTLKDERAQLRCAMFKMKQKSLNFKPELGQHVLLRGYISLYPDRGDYQMIVEQMELTGDGLLQLAFQQLNKKLSSEGLYDPSFKKVLPKIPRKIGIISSPTGAAVHDVLTVLQRRFPSIPVIIYPSLVQGSKAANQIINAIESANRRNECDVLILTRGGGSLEDLWPFNEESVARTVFSSSIPIISAIGHEIDFTICDFVADLRAPTPSAAAELITPNQFDFQQRFDQLELRLTRKILSILKSYHQNFEYLKKRLRHPQQRIIDFSIQLNESFDRLHRSFYTLLNYKKNEYLRLAKLLNTISPLSTLERGYTITTHKKTGKVIQSIKQVNEGDHLVLRLSDGLINCLVQ